MKQPKLNNLKFDAAGTRNMHYDMRQLKKIKITINVDTDTLSTIRQLAAKSGIPYQTFINRMLRETLTNKKNESTRLDRLEQEIKQIKKKLAA